MRLGSDSTKPDEPNDSKPAPPANGRYSRETAQKPAAAGGGEQITNSVGMKLTLVPSGEFRMGSGESAGDTDAFFTKNYRVGRAPLYLRGEHPQHLVRITKPFYLGSCHVTRGQFRQFVKKSGYTTDAEKGSNPGAGGWDPALKGISFKKDCSWKNVGFEQTDEHPVVNVSWGDAMAFCQWLSKKEKKTYRLPTEAEWEYACRAGTTTRYGTGNDPETLAKAANVADATAKAKSEDWIDAIKASDGYVFTAPVGQFQPNAFGLYDMHGNAWQSNSPTPITPPSGYWDHEKNPPTVLTTRWQ